MPGLYSITTRSTGTVLTAAIYNADHQNHVDNQTPQMTDDYSSSVGQMQTVNSPGGVGSESLATSLAGEFERLRYVLKTLHNGAQWYPGFDMTTAAIVFIVDNAGVAITTGIKGDLQIPFKCTIQSVTLLADQSGSIVFDIWKDTYANYPPTVADTITAGAKPTISSAVKATDATLTGWTTTIAAGDTLRFNVDSATTITRCVVILKVTKTA